MIVAFILASPIIAFGIKLAEVFEYISAHVVEISIISFAICLVIAVIWYIIRKNIPSSLFILLDCPMFAIFLAFIIAEMVKMASVGGVVWSIISFIITSILALIGLAAMAFVTFLSYLFAVGSPEDSFNDVRSNLISLFIILGCLALQILIFVFLIV